MNQRVAYGIWIVKYMVAMWDGYLRANPSARKLALIDPIIFTNALN